MASGPTERTLNLLRERGYRADVVEKWIPQAKRRKDLFGIVDIVAIGGGETLGVQCTSSTNVSHRIAKIEDSEALADLREAGWSIWVVGWRKNAQGRWVSRIEDIS